MNNLNELKKLDKDDLIQIIAYMSGTIDALGHLALQEEKYSKEILDRAIILFDLETVLND